MTSVTLCDGGLVPFSEALYEGLCSLCRHKVEWEAAFDADGTVYHAECCGLIFYMKNHTMLVSVEKGDADASVQVDM